MVSTGLDFGVDKLKAQVVVRLARMLKIRLRFKPRSLLEDMPNADFPRLLANYSTAQGQSLFGTLQERAREEPFNVAATLIFVLAIVHTFLAPAFLRASH